MCVDFKGNKDDKIKSKPDTFSSRLPGRIVCVLHSVESTGCSSLDVGDLIVKHLHTRQGAHSRQHEAARGLKAAQVSFSTTTSEKEMCIHTMTCLFSCSYVRRWTPRSRLPSLPLSSCTPLPGNFGGWRRGWRSRLSCPAWIPDRSSSRSARSALRCHPAMSEKNVRQWTWTHRCSSLLICLLFAADTSHDVLDFPATDIYCKCGRQLAEVICYSTLRMM